MKGVLVDCQPKISIFVGIFVADTYLVIIIRWVYSIRKSIYESIILMPACSRSRLVRMIIGFILTSWNCQKECQQYVNRPINFEVAFFHQHFSLLDSQMRFPYVSHEAHWAFCYSVCCYYVPYQPYYDCHLLSFQDQG